MEEDKLIKELEAAIERGETVEDVAKRHDLKVIDAVYCDDDAIYLPNGEPNKDVRAIVAEGYYADDGNADVYYSYAESGKEAAQEYMDDGDWGPDSDKTTWWHDVRAWQVAYAIVILDDEDPTPEIVSVEIDEDWHTITMEPEEPECHEDSEGHDWCSPYAVLGGLRENPGVWGNGGGVVIREVCSRCAQYRETDTWAQDSCGRQGLTSVTYRAPDEESAQWVASRQPKDDEVAQ